jgi:CheY-like chemotaxis protein/DNA-binding XRE family transcriptional regulator
MTNKHPVDLYLGRKICDIRKKRGVSQEELANFLKISRPQIQKYETGETKIATSVLWDIGKIFNIDVNYFTGDLSQIHEYTLPESDILNSERSSPLKILLIEDSSTDELLTRSAIESTGINTEIHTIRDGIEALNFLRNKKNINTIPRPDIILLDINVPKKDGFDVIKDIKGDNKIKDIPILIITNSVNTEDMIRMYKNGACGFIVKSFYPEEFFKKVKIVIDYWYNMVLPRM